MSSWDLKAEDLKILRSMLELNEENYRWGLVDKGEYELTKSRILSRIEMWEVLYGY